MDIHQTLKLYDPTDISMHTCCSTAKNRRSKVSHVARCRALHSQARGRTYIVRTTVGPNDKNPPKIRLKKIRTLTGHTFASNCI